MRTFSVSKVLILYLHFTVSSPTVFDLPFSYSCVCCFIRLEFLTGSSLFLPTLLSNLYNILYLASSFLSFCDIQNPPQIFSWKNIYMTWTTQLCKLSIINLMKVLPSIHVICGNYVLYKHTSFSCISQSQSRLFILFMEPVLLHISREKTPGILAFTLQEAPLK